MMRSTLDIDSLGSFARDMTARDRSWNFCCVCFYGAVCIAVFKIPGIPVNQWSLATAVFGGKAGIALLLLTKNYNHPFTTNAPRARNQFARTCQELRFSAAAKPRSG
jgi:hypothetical protein